MKTVIFTDIDDTLMQTRRKCPLDDSGLVVGARDRQGEPLSFTTSKQQALIRRMHAGAIVIPVTGRNLPALVRTEIGLSKSPYRITGHGAELTRIDGETPDGWQRPEAFEEDQRCLRDLFSKIARWLQRHPRLRMTLVTERDRVPVYLSVKGNRATDNRAAFDELIGQFGDALGGPDWRVHRNGNNVAFLPGFASKRRAVRFLKEMFEKQYGECLFLGVGDSYSDGEFLGECDFQLIPSASQLAMRIGTQIEATTSVF